MIFTTCPKCNDDVNCELGTETAFCKCGYSFKVFRRVVTGEDVEYSKIYDLDKNVNTICDTLDEMGDEITKLKEEVEKLKSQIKQINSNLRESRMYTTRVG